MGEGAGGGEERLDGGIADVGGVGVALVGEGGVVCQEGQLWLAGWNPTVHSRPNYEDRQPTDVNPSTGTVTEVFRKPGE